MPNRQEIKAEKRERLRGLLAEKAALPGKPIVSAVVTEGSGGLTRVTIRVMLSTALPGRGEASGSPL